MQLGSGGDGSPELMTCTRCGMARPFDETLPYVSQVAAFLTGHDCLPVVAVEAGGPAPS